MKIEIEYKDWMIIAEATATNDIESPKVEIETVIDENGECDLPAIEYSGAMDALEAKASENARSIWEEARQTERDNAADAARENF